MFKDYRVKIFLIFILLIFPIGVFAHSGRTDANGCHTNKKTGEYHCHNKPTTVATKEARSEARTEARVSANNTTKTETRLFSPSSLQSSLQVHFIDVGQGDSILIDFGQNEMLIDGGEKSPGVTNYINSYIEGPLEVIVATHPHADHIGGLIEVLDDFSVKEIWLNGDSSTSKTYKEFMVAVNLEGANIYRAKEGGLISLGNLNFTILNPPSSLFNDANNNSIVLRLKYGDTAFLFAGDAEQGAEAAMLTTGDELQADILKAGHHCSKTSSSGAFLSAVKPKEAICMVGKNNRYGHPHQETLTNLKEIGTNVYRTDINGTVTASTDGKSYKIKVSK